jgi:hypothetical protein
MIRIFGSVTWQALLFGVVLLLLSSSAYQARAEQRIGELSFAPDIVYTGIPTQVRLSIQIIRDRNLVSSSVSLMRLNRDGSRKVLARMYDDGTHGDVLANDETYTSVVEFNEPNPAVLQFQVSADYQGQSRPVLSEVFTLEVRRFPDVEGVWRQFVRRLVNRDLEGALRYMTDDAQAHYRKVFTEVGLDTVAADFRSARDLKLKGIIPDRITYTFTATIDGEDQQGQIVFWLWSAKDDIWRINSVGF